jgi:hypothetical protein
MSETRTERDVLLDIMNDRARDVREGYDKAKSDCYSLKREKQWLAHYVKQFGFLEDECRIDLQIIVRDEEQPSCDEDDKLIIKAIDFINIEYEKGKYDGRDAVGFFRTLFDRIDGMLEKFDESF